MDEKEVQELLQEFAVKIIVAMEHAEKISGLKLTPRRKFGEELNIKEFLDVEKEDRIIEEGDFAGAMKYGRCLGYLEGTLQKIICDLFTWKKENENV